MIRRPIPPGIFLMLMGLVVALMCLAWAQAARIGGVLSIGYALLSVCEVLGGLSVAGWILQSRIATQSRPGREP